MSGKIKPSSNGYELQDAGRSFTAVTKHDDNNDPNGPFRYILWTGAGNISFVNLDGETETIPSGALAANQMHKIGFLRIRDTGTTATGIYGIR